MLERLLLALDRYPRLCQAVLGALLVWAVFQLPRLRVDDSPERWLPESTREAWQVLDEHFNFGDTVAIGFEFTRPITDGDVVPLRQFRETLAKTPGVRQVYDASLLAEDIEGVPLSQLVDPANSDHFGLYEGALWSPPNPKQYSQTLLMAVELYYLRDSAEKLHDLRRGVIDKIYRMVDEAKRQPEFRDVRFHLAGGILLMDELEQRSRSAAIFLPLSMLVGIVSLLVGFHSFRALWLTVLGSGAAMLIVLGYVAWSGVGLGALTISAPTLISIIAIATTVHFAADTADHGDPSRSPVERDRLVRWVAVPCLGVAILTAVGFLMLAFNDLSPVRSLGYELFAGSLLAFFGVFIFSRLVPIRRAHRGHILTVQRFAWWSDLLGRRPGAITAAFLASMVVLALLAWPWSPTSPVGLKVDVDPFSFFGPENHLVKARNHFLDNGFGLYQLDVILIPREKEKDTNYGPGNAIYEANQEAARRYSDQLKARSDLGVLSVISTQVMRQRQAKFTDDLLKLQQLPGTLAERLSAGASRLVQLAKMTKYLNTFRETFENWNHDKKEKGAIRLTFLAHDRVPGGFAELVSLAKSSVPPQFDGYISGTITSVVQLADGLVNGLAWGVSVSVIVMALVCVVLFRSARLAAIAAVPNAFPILVVYGFMGAFGMPISSGSAMVATVSLGMNQTIYFLMRYRKLTRDEGHDTETALHECFVQIGRPVVVTSLVFTAGFLIFLVSDFLPLYHFGLLTSIAMLAGMTSDVVLLPCLLRTFDRVPRREAAMVAAEVR